MSVVLVEGMAEMLVLPALAHRRLPDAAAKVRAVPAESAQAGAGVAGEPGKTTSENSGCLRL